MAVTAADADGRLPLLTERCDQRFIHATRKHHQRGIARLCVGHAKTADELALLAHCLQRARQLHAAAMHDGDLMAVENQICDRFANGVQQLRLFQRGAAELHNVLHSNPSDSFHPHITFMFCTACPDAPFSRLSRHETSTSRCLSGASSKPMSQ